MGSPSRHKLLGATKLLSSLFRAFFTQFGLKHRKIVPLFTVIVRLEMLHDLLERLVILYMSCSEGFEIIQQLFDVLVDGSFNRWSWIRRGVRT